MTEEKWVYPYLTFGKELTFVFIFKIYLMLTVLTIICLKEFGYLGNSNAILFVFTELQIGMILGLIYLLKMIGKVLWNIGVWFYERKKVIKDD